MSLKFKESIESIGQHVVLGINDSHEASICVFLDGELICLLEEERYTKEKHTHTINHSTGYVSKAIRQTGQFRPAHFLLAYQAPTRASNFEEQYHERFSPAWYASPFYRGDNLKKFNEKKIIFENLTRHHHGVHALGAIARSGFEEALIIVSDGRGSLDGRDIYHTNNYPDIDKSDDIPEKLHSDRFEVFSIAEMKYTEQGSRLSFPFKKFWNSGNFTSPAISNAYQHIQYKKVDEYLNSIENKKFDIDNLVDASLPPGEVYQMIANHFYNLTAWDSGKIMGLSSYGKPNSNIKDIYDKYGILTEDIRDWVYHHPSVGPKKSAGYKDRDVITSRRFPFDLLWPEYKALPNKEWLHDPSKTPQEYKDFAYMLQENVQRTTYEHIKTYLEHTGHTNLVLTGGFFHNVVANYYIRKKLNEDFGPGKIKIFADPLCHDSGNSHGAAVMAMYMYRCLDELSVKKLKLESLYLGFDHKTTEQDLQDCINYYDKIDEEGTIEVVDTSFEEVASLIKDNNIVALFQGRSECGPRALGNRSILYNPTDPNGKDQVNTVKRREWFRPFAASVLYEHVDEWFDMASLDESPFMMYAVDTLEEMIEEIPAVVHVDGTCRLQTVKREQNENYYKLIEEFYKQTEIPMVLNTSFNVAGDTMVETIDDAIQTLCRSKIEYLFLPEFMKLVKCTKYFYEDE